VPIGKTGGIVVLKDGNAEQQEMIGRKPGQIGLLHLHVDKVEGKVFQNA
jgi:hypothetical protein